MKRTVIEVPFRAGRGPSGEQPPVPSLEEAASALGVDALASKDGQDTTPPATAAGPGSSELRIEDYFRRALASLNRWYAGCRAQLGHELDALETAAGRPLDVVCLDQVANDLADFRLRIQPRLVAARQAERAAERELRVFKQANGLSRDARQPESLYLHYALLAFLLMVEGLVNAWSFGLGFPWGLVGGFMQASLCAAANLAVAFAAGIGVRELVHVSPGRKAFGVSVAVAYALFLMSFTLLIGHYRIALAADPDHAATMAITQLTTDPSGAFADLHTILLMIASVGFALLAFGTAMHTRDLYPGYTEVFLRQRKAEAALMGLRELYLAQVQALFQQAPQAVAAQAAQIEANRAAVRAQREAIRQLGDRYREAVGAIESACRALMDRYRAINARVRTAPTPAYFAVPWAGFARTDLVDSAGTGGAGPTMIPVAGGPGSLDAAVAQLQTEMTRRLGAVLDEAPAFFAAADGVAEGLPGPQAVTLLSFQPALTPAPVRARLAVMR
jgi:hypothetical protein